MPLSWPRLRAAVVALMGDSKVTKARDLAVAEARDAVGAKAHDAVVAVAGDRVVIDVAASGITMQRDSAAAASRPGHRGGDSRAVHSRRSHTWLLLALLGSPAAGAHPLGNMGISHYSELVAEADHIRIRYVLDFAEIPAFLEVQKHRLPPSPAGNAPSAFMQVMTTQLAAGLSLRLDRRAVALSATRPCQGLFSAAAAGMHTLRVECEFTAATPYASARYDIHYRDNNYALRSGWKEMVLRAQAPATLIASSAPVHGRSAALTTYPAGLIDSPPQSVEARATVQRPASRAEK